MSVHALEQLCRSAVAQREDGGDLEAGIDGTEHPMQVAGSLERGEEAAHALVGHECEADAVYLPRQGGGRRAKRAGWGSMSRVSIDPHPTAIATLRRSTSPLQGEVLRSPWQSLSICDSPDLPSLSRRRQSKMIDVLARNLVESLFVTGVGIAHHADARVVGEREAKALVRRIGAVGNEGDARAGHVAGIAAAAGMNGNEIGLRGAIDERVEQRPIGD